MFTHFVEVVVVVWMRAGNVGGWRVFYVDVRGCESLTTAVFCLMYRRHRGLHSCKWWRLGLKETKTDFCCLSDVLDWDGIRIWSFSPVLCVKSRQDSVEVPIIRVKHVARSVPVFVFFKLFLYKFLIVLLSHLLHFQLLSILSHFLGIHFCAQVFILLSFFNCVRRCRVRRV